MKIHVDPLALTDHQRECLAGFLMSLSTKSRSKSAPTDEPTKDVGTSEPTAEESFGPAFTHGPEPTIEEKAATVQRLTGVAVVIPPHLATPSPIPDNMHPLTPLPTAPGGTIIDKAGFPWDVRIHAGTRAFVADGTWRKKRGTSDAEVAAVEAELRQIMSIPSPALTSTPAFQPPPVTNLIEMPAAPAVAVVIPPPLPLPVTPLPTAVASSGGLVINGDMDSFVLLVNIATDARQASKVTQAELDQLAHNEGLTEFGMIATRLDLVPTIYEKVIRLITSRG